MNNKTESEWLNDFSKVIEVENVDQGSTTKAHSYYQQLWPKWSICISKLNGFNFINPVQTQPKLMGVFIDINFFYPI